MKRALLFLGMFLVSISLFQALNLTGPSWSPTIAFTNETLNCSWSFSADTAAQNITILNGSLVYNNTFQNASSENLTTYTLVPSSDTRKSENWVCRITLYNVSTSTVANASITISNSPPTTEIPPAGIFNETGDDNGFSFQILEDTNRTIDVNATDADNDTLTYLAGDQFCTRLSSSEGTYACTPTFSDLVNNSPTLVNVTFTVTDGQNPSGRTITFNITPVNDAPTVSVADQQTEVNTSLNYTFTAADEESHFPLNFTFTAPAEVADKLSIARLNADGTSVSLFYDATVIDFDDVGLHAIQVTVIDNQSLNSSSNFTLNISAVGRPPFFTNITPSGPYNISQGEFIQINITANDPDANTTITFSDDHSTLVISTVNQYTNVSDASGQINYTPTNDDVGVFNVTITITDEETRTNETILQFNVTNVNDAPDVHEISTSAANTQNNQNTTNLTAYENAPFVFDINATDIDVIHGDTLTYADNTTLFDINTSTGRISFTPTSGDVQAQPYHINISVVDSGGLRANRTIFLTINANNPPFFNATLQQLSCTTKALCTSNLAQFTDDPDAGDNVSLYNITFIGSTLSSFSINTATGLINFTTQKTDVGNYTINVTISDSFGATNWSLMNISINNTPEAPNLTQFDFSNETVVETFPFTYEFIAQDDDFLVVSENLTFTTNFSLAHSITPLPTQNTSGRALLSFTPADGTAGNYTISINVTDIFGLTDNQTITFEIFPDVPPPNISQINPWGNGATFDIQTTFRNTTDAAFTDNVADVNVSENTSVTFATIVIDTRPVTYEWKVNGTTVATTENYTRAFDFFSSGRQLVQVNVSNDRFEHSIFTWDLIITNENRPPELQTSLSDLTVNGSLQQLNYFVLGSSVNRFFDPDDDTDSNGEIDGNETVSLTFTQNTACSIASIAISGSDITVTGSEVGSCTVTFNATDTDGVQLESNSVTINITAVPQGATETVTTTTSSGGGGSSSSTFIPFLNKKTTPEAFHLLAPKLVTLYSNESITIPITINNTWHDALQFVQLSVQTNESTVQAGLDVDFFEEIPVNESRDVVLTVDKYRIGENYEVIIKGNVTTPNYEDEVLILLNSLEQSQDGENVNVKVTFANDLLSQNPECQELNEILNEAKRNLQANRVDDARALVDNVINGCKYLVSTQQAIEERPTKIKPVITIENLSLRTLMWSVLAFVIFMSMAFLLYYHFSYAPEEDI